MKRDQLHRIKRKLRDQERDPEGRSLPKPLPVEAEQKLVYVYVEGYEDVAFWRGIFDHFSNPYLRFEISVPTRRDLPKGKKVLMGMIPKSSQETLLCVDSDFDYLFSDMTQQSKELNGAEYMFHTYAYATENYLCYAPSLHNVCVKATKNDMRIFDFEHFLAEYSKAIYPAFLWYLYSAQLSSESIFILTEFRATVKIGYLEIDECGASTVNWVARNVARRVANLAEQHPDMKDKLSEFQTLIERRGVTAESCYLYMHGHTLMDNVVMIALTAVCEKLRQIALARIVSSSKEGTALKNEISNYNNEQRSIRDVLLDNENYRSCHLYRLLHADIARYIVCCVWDMKRRGEIADEPMAKILNAISL